MSIPHSGDDKARKILDRTLKKYNRYQEPTPLKTPAWGPDFFLLKRSAFFATLHEDIQQTILETLSLSMLLESYGFEKLGIGYCGKLANIATNMEERQIFSLMGAEEATHFQWLVPYIPVEYQTSYMSPYLALMDEMIDIDVPNTLYYLVQIILEGWAIHHYKSLYSQCQDASLKNILKNILRDESNHHQIGKTFFEVQNLSLKDKAIIVDCLKGYTDFVRMGTGTKHIIKVIDEACGGLSSKHKQQLLDDLCFEQTTHLKLKLYKQLMCQPGLEEIIQTLEDQDYFKAYRA